MRDIAAVSTQTEHLHIKVRSGDVLPVSKCRTAGMSTDWIDNHVSLLSDGAVWLRSALRPQPTARAYCDVCLLFITALLSLFPRHLIRPDFRVIAIYPTAASDSCTWRRRDEEVRKTFAFL